MEIVDFVDLDDIDPIYYKSTYYLAPQGEQAVRAYALLRQAMIEEKKVGIATLVLRNKQHWWPSARPRRCSPSRRCISPTKSAIRPPRSTRSPAT